MRLDFDRSGDGLIDVRTYMDGNRPVRSEVDTDLDGRIDRWEYYDATGRLVRVGVSSREDGLDDTWFVPDPSGRPARIDRAPDRDGFVARREHYRDGVLVAVEEDSDRDGRIDKWETYQDGILVRLDVDLSRRGRPDYRLVYDPSGALLRTEADPDGDGIFRTMDAPRLPAHPGRR